MTYLINREINKLDYALQIDFKIKVSLVLLTQATMALWEKPFHNLDQKILETALFTNFKLYDIIIDITTH